MPRISIFLIALLSFSSGLRAADPSSAHTPATGSTERTEILNALRKPVQEELKQPVVFKIDHFLAQGNWTFLMGTPQAPDGKTINYKGTKYQEYIDDQSFDNSFCALLQRQDDGNWKVISWQIGATDAIWITWPQDFKAPAAVFPPLGPG